MSTTHPTRILLTTDFSANAAQAYPYAVGLADSFDAELHVLHVMTPLTYHYQDILTLKSYTDVALSGRRSELAHLDLGLRNGTSVRREVINAPSVPDGIIASAETLRSDLIVMSSHGRHGLARLVRGSVAAKVTALAPCPVLCVKADESGMLDPTSRKLHVDRILVPIDLSGACSGVLDAAIALGREWSAAIHIVTAIPEELPPVYSTPPLIATYESGQPLRARVVGQLAGSAARVRSQGLQAHSSLRVGSAVKEIVHYADDHDIDLIITHRRTPSTAFHYLGDITDRLLQAAHHPLLVV
jgi:nucleotide-binding universal stress UspA family protein